MAITKNVVTFYILVITSKFRYHHNGVQALSSAAKFKFVAHADIQRL